MYVPRLFIVQWTAILNKYLLSAFSLESRRSMVQTVSEDFAAMESARMDRVMKKLQTVTVSKCFTPSHIASTHNVKTSSTIFIVKDRNEPCAFCFCNHLLSHLVVYFISPYLTMFCL